MTPAEGSIILFSILKTILQTLLIYLAAIVLHEVLHVAYFKRKLKKEVGIFLKGNDIVIGKPEDYEGMTLQQNKEFLLIAVAGGFFPICLGMAVFGAWAALATIPYLYNSFPDIKSIYAISKLQEKDLNTSS